VVHEPPAGGVETDVMLWDCPDCGTPKLLGSTHNFCPACGTAQAPEAQYPASSQHKLTLADHSFVGRDLLCLTCQTPNSAAANNCAGCGCPLAGAREIGYRGSFGRGEAFAGESGAFVDAALQRARQVSAKRLLAGAAANEAAAAEATRNRRRVIMVGLLIGVGILMFVRSRDRDVEVQITGHSWSRTIEIEQFREVEQTKSCDEVPARAVVLRELPGTDRCEYRMKAWGTLAVVESKGTGLSPEPTWPDVRLRVTGEGNCDRCEREGERVEVYAVSVSYDGKAQTCAFDLDTWRSFAVGDQFTVRPNPETDGLDCGLLVTHE
jgi:hypothetical protein